MSTVIHTKTDTGLIGFDRAEEISGFIIQEIKPYNVFCIWYKTMPRNEDTHWQ